jgi:hypothetical protein
LTLPPSDHEHTPTAEQLAAIEAAFNELHKGLHEATKLFVEGEDAERRGVIDALKAVIEFLLKSSAINSQGHFLPLARLYDDLLALDAGKASKLLTPKTRSGRAPASGFEEGLKGLAVFIVRRLAKTKGRAKKSLRLWTRLA